LGEITLRLRKAPSLIGKSRPWPSGTFKRVTRRLDAAKL
jgi:hypothetical protein